MTHKWIVQHGFTKTVHIVLIFVALNSGSMPASALTQPGGTNQEIQSSTFPIAPDLRFTHLSIEDGLSQTTITSILQDSHGFMWFGTQDGLNRYDGYNFVVYRNNPNDLNSLGGNQIRKIVQDASGIIWIGTSGGELNKYDPEADTFIRFIHEPENPNSLKNNVIWNILVDKTGLLWLYMDDGWLTKFDPKNETFTHYHSDITAPFDIEVTYYESKALYQDKNDDLWLSNYKGGLAKFDHNTGRFTYFFHKPDNTTTISTGGVTNIYEDETGRFWVCTTNGGLNLMDRESGTFKHFQNDPSNPYSLSDNNCHQILQDHMGLYWVVTGRGLNIFNPDTGKFSQYHKDSSNPYALSDDNISTVYEDRGGILWFGTYGGLNKLDLGTIQFEHYRHIADNPHSLSTSYIYSIFEDKDGILWVGGDDGVLNRFDREHNQVTRYEPNADDPNALNESWSVSALYEDHTGTFWVGTFSGGLHTFDRKTGKFQRYLHDSNEPHSISSDIILAIHEDRIGNLWIGTEGGGLDRFDRKTGMFHHYLPDSTNPNDHRPTSVRDIYEDSTGFLWLSSWYEGLTLFDPRTEQFVNYRHDPENIESLGSDLTYVVHEDRAGTLWVGTDGGLDHFDRRTNSFYHYTVQDGLPNNVIYAIMEDAFGNLWVSTNRGISKFDPHVLTFQNYNVFDGLQSDEFNQSAYFQSTDGEMFFGGINGLNAFHPEQVTSNPYRPPVILTDLQLFNQSIPIGKDAILSKPIWDTDQITLNYDHDVFSIAFAALSYAAPAENLYRYKLEGFDEDWNDVDAKRRFASYTNISPGEYTLRVQGSNKDGVWNEDGVSLKIIITPPWWGTWWFKGGMLAAILSLVLAVYHIRVKSLERSNRELYFAYEATIEGWSRALDLRDHETEGHTQRVTELALRLADVMGMSDVEKANLRRGALLHDIGKMGVPDAILHKPGALTEHEWNIMRQHPSYAYQMLSPITYLKPALEISYCHHEKWDGTGYPNELKGSEIPLAARVFAVVDVYDALTSDRPYRKAWPLEETYKYIQSQSGKHFDPLVVQALLKLREYL